MKDTFNGSSGASPPEPVRKADFSLYFKTAPRSRTKPLGTKFKHHPPPKTKDDLRRLRARLRATPNKRRQSAPKENER